MNIFSWVSIGISLMVAFPVAWAGDNEMSRSDNIQACSNISGEYSFLGTVEANNQDYPITFLQRMSRPSRIGVRWVRIVQAKNLGEFDVSFLGAEGNAIGKDVLIKAQCESGNWKETDSFQGNSDGTLVRGTRTWSYTRDNNGDLIVECSGSSTSEYFPGISSSNHVTNFAHFPHKPM